MADESENSALLPLEERLASPLDRLAANVADFVIISPVAAFIMSPFRRLASEAMLQGRDDAWMIATVSAVGLSLLFFVAYQTFFLVKWRATPGKRMFGLSVETLWAEEGTAIRPQAAFARALTMCFEALLLGFPWIGVIGNERRRPLHDRVADTIVLSNKRSRVGVPGLHERSLASGLVAAFFTSLLIVATFKIGQLHFSVGAQDSASRAEGEDANENLCDAVERAEENWTPGLGEKKPSRIAIALALFEAEAIEADCLKTEADATLWSVGERDLAYLARGLAEKDEALSQEYLNKACNTKKQTDACRAVAVLNETELPDDPVEAKAAKVVRDTELLALTSSIRAESQPFLKIIAIRELLSHRQNARALSLIEAMSPSSQSLSFFMTSERLKALWALGEKQEARAALKTAVASFDPDQRVVMSRWFCAAETSENGCSPAARTSCDLLAASVEKDKVLLGDPEVTAAFIRGETCANRLSEERLVDLKSDAPDVNSQNYLESLALMARGEQAKGLELLKTIAAKEDGPYFIEASLKLVSLAKSEKELSSVREAWSDADSNIEGWVTLGRALMERYNSFTAWDQTVEMGFKIGENETHELSTLRPLIVAAYRSGQTEMAAGYWQTYFQAQAQSQSKKVELIDQARAPASADGFDEVVHEIEADLAAPPVPARRPTAAAPAGAATTVRAAPAMPRLLPPKAKALVR